MKKLSLCLFLLAIILGLGRATAYAQNDDPKVDVFLGYSFMTSDFGDFYQNMNGFAASVTLNLNRHVAVEANLNGSFGTANVTSLATNNGTFGQMFRQNQEDYFYLFGPKVQTSIGKVDLFSHFLVGAAHLRFNDQDHSLQSFGSARITPFSAGVGGGADWNFRKGRFGWRILELDYLFSRNSGSESGQLNNVRLETGLVAHF